MPLLKGVPTSLVAKLHDTSIGQIEKHYGKYIASIADKIARPALLEMPTMPAPEPEGVDEP